MLELRERDLIREIANEEEVGIARVRRVLDTFLSSIKSQVYAGKRVRIKGLGTFSLQQSFEGKPKISFVDTYDDFGPDTELLRSDLIVLVSLKENVPKSVVEKIVKSFIYKFHRLGNSGEIKVEFKDFGIFLIKERRIFISFD